MHPPQKKASKKLGDLFAKCRFLEWLIKKNRTKSYCLTSELLFSPENRFADIVKITRSRTTAYEIKSENDTIARLNKQLNCYLETFDYTYIVCHKKHSEKVMEIAPPEVGVISETSASKFEVLRQATLSPHITVLSLLSHFNRAELQQICKKQLESSLPIDIVRKRVAHDVNLNFLKNLYRTNLFERYIFLSERFLREINKDSIHPDDLLTLSRTANVKQSIWRPSTSE